VLNNIGIVCVVIGDMDGIDDLEWSVLIVVEVNLIESVWVYGNFVLVFYDFGEFEWVWFMSVEVFCLGECFGVDDWLCWIWGDWCWDFYF